MVACVAGVGAWGAMVTVKAGPAYASELFGENHPSPKYPQGMEPMVTLTIPANVLDDAATTDVDETQNHNGSAEITFTLHGAVFDASVTALMFDVDGPPMQGPDGGTDADILCDTDTSDLGCTDPVVAQGDIASIVSGGIKGGNTLTIKVEATSTDTTGVDAAALASRDSGSNSADGTTTTNGRLQTISFEVPRLAGLSGLGGANPKDAEKRVWLSATSRLVSGAFTGGELVPAIPGTTPPIRRAKVITAMDSLTLDVRDGATHMIAIDDKGDDKAFTVVKGGGQAMVGTVQITTVQTAKAAVGKTGRSSVGFLQSTGGSDDPAADAELQEIFVPGKPATPAEDLVLYDLNGDMITKGLPGTFAVSAMGSENFGMDDMLYVDYNGNKKMDGGEGITIEKGSMMAQGRSISIDSIEKSASYNVYYVPGGEDRITHDSTLTVSASVAYNSSSALPEPGDKTENMFRYDGVGNAVMAYAIPHSGAMDIGNVRVRCEQAMACRVFLECFDDMGMREFAEVPDGIGGNSVAVWNGAAIESVTGLEPSSRISCQILSKGMISVQQLTRSNGVLVNNTYVSDQN